MHPAARVFLIAVVIVLVCSHLILNIMTDKPAHVSRQLTPESVHQPSVEGVNDDVNTATIGTDLMDRIGDMDLENRELDVGTMESSGKQLKPPVEVVVKQQSNADEESSEDGERDEETDVDGVERMDKGEDCDGDDGDGSSQ